MRMATEADDNSEWCGGADVYEQRAGPCETRVKRAPQHTETENLCHKLLD